MKIARLLAASLVLVLLIGGLAVRADWSLLHPFSSGTTDSKPATKPAPQWKPTPPAKPAQPPSTVQKMTSGTKNFFTGVGNTLTGKKTPAKKPSPYTMSSGNNTTVGAAAKSKQSSTSSWSLFHKEEKKKQPQTLSDFVGMPRPE